MGLLGVVSWLRSQQGQVGLPFLPAWPGSQLHSEERMPSVKSAKHFTLAESRGIASQAGVCNHRSYSCDRLCRRQWMEGVGDVFLLFMEKVHFHSWSFITCSPYSLLCFLSCFTVEEVQQPCEDSATALPTLPVLVTVTGLSCSFLSLFRKRKRKHDQKGTPLPAWYSHCCKPQHMAVFACKKRPTTKMSSLKDFPCIY